MTLALLVTYALAPDGEPGGEELLPAELAARGIDARWVCWDDPDVDWAAADVVAVRAAWDYHRRLAPFLEWAREVEEETLLLNGADVFAWNADKAYLADLGSVPVVPTELLDDSSLVPGLRSAIDRYDEVVVKPRVGASGLGVVIASTWTDHRLDGLMPAPWIVQPLVPSVRTEGEVSVYVFDGGAVSQVDKRPAGGEIRVHELYGGGARPGRLTAETARVAELAVAEVAERFGAVPAYARVDLMRFEGTLMVSEVELIEPGLYLDVTPANAGLFADAVAAQLR